MHEMPIAVEIVERTCEVAREHRAVRVEQVEVEVGAMRQVVPEALELAFEAASDGTVVEGARLEVIEQQVISVCNACECMFPPDIESSFVCPRCGQADGRIVAGNDIILKTVICEADEEVSA